nr:efflux RND transporter periplasmic adaptor subunit [Novosphingobium nitrogenifigens]
MPPMGPAEVGVVTLVAEPVTVSNELTGRTAATTASDVRPQVDGVIKARLFEEGSIVHAGQPLYQIDPRLYKASLDQARGQLENAQATLFTNQAKADRYKTLRDNQAVSRQDIDDTIAAARTARASVHQYQATVQSARVNLEYTRVLAPITGRISRSTVTPGALVTSGQTTALATIQQLDPIYVDITQSSSDLVKLRMALANGSVLPATATVHLKLEDGSDYPLTGTIEFSEVTVDEQAGTVTLRARFPNPQGLLLPGMFVRVVTPQGVVPKGILAPQQGITRDAKGDATALVVDASNKVVLRNVVADKAIGNKWLVTSGLKAGDRLIVEGVDKAEPGAVVKPVPVKLGY